VGWDAEPTQEGYLGGPIDRLNAPHTEPRIPKDSQAALASAPEVSEVWNDITPMARWEWIRWISATKNPETRKRRIRVGISKLRSGKRRLCCFDLAACTDPDLSKSGKLVEPFTT
jgi:hypothetical protein